MHTCKGFSNSAEANLLHDYLGTNDQIIENVKTCSHLIMKLPDRKITLKHQKGEPL